MRDTFRHVFLCVMFFGHTADLSMCCAAIKLRQQICRHVVLLWRHDDGGEFERSRLSTLPHVRSNPDVDLPGQHLPLQQYRTPGAIFSNAH